MSEETTTIKRGNGGPSWKGVAYAALTVIWIIIAALTGWTMESVMQLKIEMARVETKLGIPDEAANKGNEGRDIVSTLQP